MANEKISELTALTTPAAGDLIPIVDVSDTTDAASGTTKKIAVSDLTSGGAIPFEQIVAISDETTPITTGAAKVTFRIAKAVNVTAVRASLSTSSSSGNPAFDVNKNGTTIFSTPLTIDSGEKTSATAATASALTSSPTAFAEDDEVTIDIDTAGTGAMGAKITLIGTYQ